ncbi:MAG TPA: prepilin-type N-terminal cleavage/methylation domain-containing protein [Thermoanaerobaculia bacterium]|nr:prepilin-type N-terminal cleavage/methylation domain-containing protein [Thermoanaerobaculia bacterium]
MSTLTKTSRIRPASGFTLIEILLVMALALILMLIGFPALNKMISRSKIEGAARQTEAFLRLSRYEAIKRGVATGIRADFTKNRLLVYVNADNKFKVGNNPVLAQYVLPQGVAFWSAQDAGADGSNALINVKNKDASGGEILFDSTGAQISSVDGSSGAGAVGFNFGDPAGNFLQVRITTPSTGNMELLKWTASVSSCSADLQANGGCYTLNGQYGKQWSWN